MAKIRQVPNGHKVFVSHFRQYEDPYGHRYYSDLPLARHDRLIPQGGITEVVLLDNKKEDIACGMAYCSPRDNFCKRIGRDIATGRALKQLENGTIFT